MRRLCIGARTPAAPLTQLRPNATQVARRALELYERRSSIDGWDLDDASEAEHEPIQERQRAGRDS